MKIEHLGIATDDLDAANRLYAQLLGKPHYKIEAVESEGVLTSFFRTGESKVEFVAASRPDSTIAKYIERRGPGIHHVAFGVRDIHAEMERLRDAGFRLLNEEPKRGADNKMVCFIHPKSTGGVLVELCQDADEGPLTLEKFKHQFEIPVQWGEMDAANHVNNTVYLRYAETARIEFFEQTGIGSAFNEIGAILGYQDCKYIFPLRYPDTVVAGTRVLETLSDRLVLQCALFSKNHDRIAAISHQEILAYDYKALRKVPLPEQWKGV